MNLYQLSTRYMCITAKRTHVVLPLLIMAGLYWLSSLPGIPLPDDPELYALVYLISPSLQNALHVPAYAALGATWHWVLGAWLHVPTVRVWTAFTFALVFGVFDEWHQSFVPGRYASLTDVMLNIMGITLGIWLAACASRYARSCAPAVASRRDVRATPLD
jgi:hypothetical protein